MTLTPLSGSLTPAFSCPQHGPPCTSSRCARGLPPLSQGLALGPVPSGCILQKPPGHLPTPGFASLVQLPELSLQPLLHGGWVLTASSSFFWKADDVAILNSCAPGLSAPRDFLARPLLLAFSICGGRVACSVFFHSLLTYPGGSRDRVPLAMVPASHGAAFTGADRL